VDASFKINRRSFLQAAIATAAAAGTGVACSRNRTPWRFFSVDEARALAAMSDQIIPPDQDPGAAWAGVVNYIDRQLCRPFQNLQKLYRQGLASVDQSSRSAYGKFFADLDSDQQVALLRALEFGHVQREIWKEISSQEFFATVVDHAMQGYYGDPRHGGNLDGVSWKMLGIPYPPIRGRLPKATALVRATETLQG
jgi:gluconate 2-dehydrogenase gamma chain